MSPIRILIVEDEVPISRLLETSLTQAGYQCTCACLLYTSDAADD